LTPPVMAHVSARVRLVQRDTIRTVPDAGAFHLCCSLKKYG